MPKKKKTMKEALMEFIAAINATGGLQQDTKADGKPLVPVGDPEWLDLAEAYVSACEAMHLTPVVEEPCQT